MNIIPKNKTKSNPRLSTNEIRAIALDADLSFSTVQKYVSGDSLPREKTVAVILESWSKVKSNNVNILDNEIANARHLIRETEHHISRLEAAKDLIVTKDGKMSLLSGNEAA